ncbi:hypothetical protein CTE07_20370 [Chitinophaga terrae (ex Kim and Jung 2007)]|nr:hypothetical protein CTE07_20370 [Chitinophaga terrae (ex Kim and Jung 2007)]
MNGVSIRRLLSGIAIPAIQYQNEKKKAEPKTVLHKGAIKCIALTSRQDNASWGYLYGSSMNGKVLSINCKVKANLYLEILLYIGL